MYEHYSSVYAMTLLLSIFFQVEIPSDDEEEEVITITEETYKPMSLEKMVTLIAMLVEKSRGENNQLHISDKDYTAIIGGKGFPFLFNQIRDSINIRQTCNLLFSLSRWNEQLAIAVCILFLINEVFVVVVALLLLLCSILLL